MKRLAYLTSLAALLAVLSNPLRAETLFDIDFTPPDVGSYWLPPGSNPTVVSSFGGFSDTMLFHLNSGSDVEDMDLLWNTRYPAYTIDFDVVTQGLNSSRYEFVLYSGVGRVSLHGGLNAVEVFQSSPYTDRAVQPFTDGVPYHFTLSADFEGNLWRLSVDGVSVYSNIPSSTDPGIRFRLTSWYQGAAYDPNVMVALDNIRVEVVPEPSSGALLLIALLGLCARKADQFRRANHRSAGQSGGSGVFAHGF